jgi:3-phosphoshikimate 1-carboxyvinyltransferase
MILRVPGDKSITQRALIIGGLATGTSRLRGLLPGADPRSTAGALRSLGVAVPTLPSDGGEIVIEGLGLRGLEPSAEPLDLGNSGTGARLLLGVLAGQSFSTTLTGDASLRTRPMRRITEPLSAMGGVFEELGQEGRLPLRVHGGPLRPLEYDLPVASAQVKSAVLLAGLVGGAFVLLTEPGRSRDHTERMLTASGATVLVHDRGRGRRVELRDPPGSLRPLDLSVPGDFSSAAFWVVLGLLGGAGDELVLPDVGLNPTRTGLLPILSRMGARIEVLETGPTDGAEPVGSLVVRPSTLRATDVTEEEIPAAIDEIPALAVAASRAEGVTRIRGARELRVKETDRLSALARNLRSVGVVVEELPDGLEIEGTEAPPDGRVDSFDDHRIAMAFGVLGALPGASVEVTDPAVVDVSYPTFWDDLESVVAAREDAVTARRAGDPGAPPDPHETVVTIDGPAGSGKSTTAREVARRLGWRYLDSGALYRALTYALLHQSIAPRSWEALGAEELAALGVEVDASGSTLSIHHEGRTLDAELRSEEVTAHVSRLAALPAVRDWLLEAQRSAGAEGHLVADGRDMGTVVFPRAGTKIYLRAASEERARRRLGDKGVSEPADEDISVEVRLLEERDRRDSEREHSPLRVPEDAVVIDTTDLEFEEQVQRIVRHVRRGTGGSASGQS